MSDLHNAPQPDGPMFLPPTVEELAAMLPSYEVHFLIASGGMGAVYKGCQKDLDRLVAIKILPPDAGTDVESLARFRSEARAMAKLNHPNIVSIYDFGAVQGQCYFVMEYVEGRNVHELITEGLVSPELALNLLGQVSDALGYAHAKSIVHGDIKPSNIVVDAEGNVKLLDFGLARLMEQDQTDTEADWVPMGTPEYAAPELYERGSVADPRTDIYALGVVYYEMLMRTVPSGTFTLPTTTLPVDQRVDDIIVRCLRADPEERFQSAAELKQILEDIRTGKPIAAAPTSSNRSAKQVTIMRPSARRAPLPTPTGTRPAGARSPSPTARGNLDRIAKLEAETKAKQKKLVLNGTIILAVAAVLGITALIIKGSTPKPVDTVVEKQGSEPKPQPAPTPEPVKFAPPRPDPVIAPTPPKADPKPVAQTPPDMVKEPTPTKVEPSVPPPPVVTISDPAPMLTKLKKEFTERYLTEVQNKIQAQEKDFGEKYKGALAKLEPEFLSRSDASGVIQVRTELERFTNTNTPPVTTELARNEKVADLQKKLIATLAAVRKNFAGPIKKINDDFNEALARLSNSLTGEGKKEEAEAVKAFRDTGAKAPDYVGALAGFAVMPVAPAPSKGEIVAGNVAQATMGAEARAKSNPNGLIDGVDERENSGYSDVGGSLDIIFDKIYQIEQICFHLPRSEGNSYRFDLEGSLDDKTWFSLVKKSDEDSQGYVFLNIPPQPLKAFRILPTQVIGTKHFTVEEVAAFCQGKKPDTWGDRVKESKSK